MEILKGINHLKEANVIMVLTNLLRLSVEFKQLIQLHKLKGTPQFFFGSLCIWIALKTVCGFSVGIFPMKSCKSLVNVDNGMHTAHYTQMRSRQSTKSNMVAI